MEVATVAAEIAELAMAMVEMAEEAMVEAATVETGMVAVALGWRWRGMRAEEKSVVARCRYHTMPCYTAVRHAPP